MMYLVYKNFLSLKNIFWEAFREFRIFPKIQSETMSNIHIIKFGGMWYYVSNISLHEW